MKNRIQKEMKYFIKQYLYHKKHRYQNFINMRQYILKVHFAQVRGLSNKNWYTKCPALERFLVSYIYKQTNQRVAEATFVQIRWEVPKPPQKIDKIQFIHCDFHLSLS
jgi:hypothetical protein